MKRASLRGAAIGVCLAGVFAMLTAGAAACALAAGAAERPSFLVIISDDQTWTDNGCYGHPIVRTPNIDRLAGQGMRFTRAFTATGMCSPSRSAMYTGLYPVRNGAYPNHSQVRPGVRSMPTYLAELGYRVALAGKTHIGPKEQFPFEYMKRGEIGRFLEDVAGAPFCLVFATNDPHLPWAKNTSYDPDRFTVPPYLVDLPETRAAMADYYTDVTNMDKEVGQALAALDDAGRADDTLVIYTSDQGAQFPFGKWTCYDTGLRVPLVARWPGRIPGGTTSDAMIHFVDVVPTLVELAGGSPPEDLDGRSFADVLRGKTSKHHDCVFGIQTTLGIIDATEPYAIRSVRTDRYHYIRNLNADGAFYNVLISKDKRYWPAWVERAKTDPNAAKLVRRYQHRPAEELYDVESDPYELDNLADAPALQSVKSELAKRLDEWMRRQGDKGVATELEAFERQGRKRRKPEPAKTRR